jgi:hypothetical protein
MKNLLPHKNHLSQRSNPFCSNCRVGIVFYGRQSLGGHNVVWRLYEAIKAHYQNIKLTGFLGE